MDNMIEVNVKFPKSTYLKDKLGTIKGIIPESSKIRPINFIENSNIIDIINDHDTKMIVVYVDPSFYKESSLRKKFREKYSYFPLDIDWFFIDKTNKFYNIFDDNKLYSLAKRNNKYFIEEANDEIYNIVLNYSHIEEAINCLDEQYIIAFNKDKKKDRVNGQFRKDRYITNNYWFG